jgi:type II secretory pathway component PulF
VVDAAGVPEPWLPQAVSAVSMETDSNRLKILFLFIVILLVFRRKIRAPVARRGFILLVLKIHLSIANGLPP